MHTLLGFLVATQFLTMNADATPSEKQITWSMEIAFPPNVQPGLRLLLIQPLVAVVDVGTDLGGLLPLRDSAGRLLGFVVTHPLPEHHPGGQCVRVGTIAFTVPRWEDALEPPLLQGHVLQRLTLQNGWRFTPTAPGLQQHVGFFSHADTTHAARKAVDDLLTQQHPPPSSQRAYLTGDTATIRGHWDSPEQHRAKGAWFAAVIFPVALVGLVFGARRLQRTVALERAEADLAEAYKELER